jgi:excisionase family DNA binding protein
VQTEWLTTTEAAQHLKLKPRTLTQWAREGKVPAHKLCGVSRCTWRFLRSELDAMLTSASTGPADGRQQ